MSSARTLVCTEDMSLLMQLPIFLRDLAGVECDVSDDDEGEDEDPPNSSMYTPDYVAGKRGKLKAKSTAADRCEYLVRWKNYGDATWEDACAKVCPPCLARCHPSPPPAWVFVSTGLPTWFACSNCAFAFLLSQP